MFTGIITNQAIVKKKEKRGGQVCFRFSLVRAEKRPLELGESVAVNGVCLTVAKKSGKNFEADAVRETLEATTLGRLETGAKVNTERALRFGDPVGGHFVSGHVDGRAVIKKIEKQGRNRAYWMEVPAPFKKFLMPKGSAAVDGVSLTIQEVRGRQFKAAIVPHTLKETVFSERRAGDWVNLEVDRTAGKKMPGGLKVSALKRQGF